jgi:NAD(P)-dependent dehydrogenase (short-subunit alcohol dehydrogenase family)
VKVSEDELDQLIAVNLKGPLFLSTAALTHLAADGGGSIVNVGALGATQPMEGIGAYCAVKAAMANWSTTMAREWAAQGVRVNVLVPGSIATDMILPTDPDRRAAFVEEMSTQNVFGRLGDPDDMVGAAVFLAGDASRYMTGRSVFVDGGLLR